MIGQGTGAQTLATRVVVGNGVQETVEALHKVADLLAANGGAVNTTIYASEERGEVDLQVNGLNVKCRFEIS